jgi:hypothetical protein
MKNKRDTLLEFISRDVHQREGEEINLLFNAGAISYGD